MARAKKIQMTPELAEGVAAAVQSLLGTGDFLEPVEFMMDIAMGRDPRHASEVWEWSQEIQKKNGRKPPSPGQWDLLLDVIREHHRQKEVPLELSTRVMAQLMEYMQPKLKQIEVTTTDQEGGAATPLTKGEAKGFWKYFDGRY
jgi:hypothetical protein